MKFVKADVTAGLVPVSLLYRSPDGGNHRRGVRPDDDLSSLPAETQEQIRAHWAGLDLAAWQAIVRPPAPPVTPADIKTEAMRRILAVLPEWQQRNLMARAVELVVALVNNRGWTPEQASEQAQIRAQWDRVKAIRDRSNHLEQSLPADFAGNQNWPT